MKRLVIGFLVGIYFSCLSSTNLMAIDDAKELDRLIDGMDNLWVENKTFSLLEMKIVTHHYTRDLKMQFWGKAKEKSLVKITYPAKENGVCTLKVKDDVYNYLPKVARTIKLSQALMGQSWMGSHFTNDDLVRVTHLREDYNSKVIQKKGSGAGEQWIVEATAKPETVSPWRTMLITFARASELPLEQQFFNKHKTLERVMFFKKIKEFDGKKIPSLVRVEPTEGPQKGEYTELIYKKIDQKAKFEEEIFELTNLSNQ